MSVSQADLIDDNYRSEPVSEHIGICNLLRGPETLKSIDAIKYLIALKLDHKTNQKVQSPPFSTCNICPPLPRCAVRREHRQIDLTGVRLILNHRSECAL